jgi:hypothetical protein
MPRSRFHLVNRPASLFAPLALVLFVSWAATAANAASLSLSWTNNMLTISGPELPGKSFNVWWLEAFCRKGSTKRVWDQTTIPHKTELLSASADGTHLRLRSRVEPNVEVLHELQAHQNDVDCQLVLKNHDSRPVDLEWLEPCIRVDRFTGLKQSTYISKSFIFTDRGLTFLDAMPRNEEALYRGGQVYVPPEISLEDVNPRPISTVRPVNALIGCLSADGQYLLASAWSRTQHLFQGVIVCLHNDPHVGGLAAGETKKLHGKFYVMKNDPAELLRRYQQDFGTAPEFSPK